jgi:hypothetical protein
MQGMQNTQNMFSFSTAPNPSGQASGLKTESGEKEAQGEGVFASFLASLTQAVESQAVEKGNNNIVFPDFLDLTFSAEQGENREEYTTSLPLEGMSLFFSKPVLDLLASLKEDLGELKEKGVDIDLISEQVGELLDETLPEVDAERLESLMTKLRDQYETVVASGPRHLDIEVALSKDLKLGLEASLKHFQGNPQENPEGGIQNDMTETITETTEELESAESFEGLNGTLLLPAAFFPSGEAGGGTEEKTTEKTEKADEPQSLILPRLYAYLKPDEPRVPSSKTTVKTNSSSVDGKEKASSEPTAGSEAAVLSVVPAHDAVSREESPVAEIPFQGKIQGKSQGAPDRFVFDAKGKDPEGADTGVKAGTAETAKFDQFFQGILSRSGSSEARFDAEISESLELAKETPLSQNEALREGLNNVVRFIRTSGEQKAALIVDPPALGRVSVELTSSTTGLEASIKVSSEQIRQLVQDQLAQLRLTLEQQGVQLTHFSVDVQQDGGQRQQQQTAEQKRRFGGLSDGEEDEEQTVFRVDLDKGLLYWVA